MLLEVLRALRRLLRRPHPLVVLQKKKRKNAIPHYALLSSRGAFVPRLLLLSQSRVERVVPLFNKEAEENFGRILKKKKRKKDERKKTHKTTTQKIIFRQQSPELL